MSVTLSFTVSNETAKRVVDAWATHYGYQEKIPNPEKEGELIDNPQSKQEFVKQKIAQVIKDTTLAVERKKSVETMTQQDINITTN